MRPIPAMRLAYHQQTLDYLKNAEPELWRWFSSTACQDEYAKAARLELLKSCYRFERADAGDLYALCDEVAAATGVTAAVTLYQSQSGDRMNMMLAYMPDEAHVVFEGPLRTTLTRDELRSTIAHELAHYALWREAGGEMLIADQMLSAMASHPAAQPSHLESARLFRLYTEIYADRGALAACGDPLTAIAALIKVETGVTDVNAQSYVRQATEVFAQADVKAEELTHPESYIRAWALNRWASDPEHADADIRRAIEGRLDLDRLSLLGQDQLTRMTRRPNVLDKVMAEARRDAAEFGFSQLRLVICFLRWTNLKEDKDERIDSPLLLLPIGLTKKKGIRDSYVLTATGGEAEVNPVLRYFLKQLYDITLPFSVDLNETTITAFYDALVAQIHASEPGVTLNRIDRPQVELVYARARRRLDQYTRRLRLGVSFKTFGQFDYSYNRENYQPLGLRLFSSVVRPSPAPLQDIFRDSRVHEAHMTGTATPPQPDAGEQQKVMAAFREGANDGNPYVWDFDLCNLTLGNFNYRKMSLIRDYNMLLERERPSVTFDAVSAISPSAPSTKSDTALRYSWIADATATTGVTSSSATC